MKIRKQDVFLLSLIFALFVIGCEDNPTSSNNNGSETVDLVFVEGGTFQMGDRIGDGDEAETPLHEVTLSSFSIGKYEITHTQFIEFLNSYGVSSNGYYNETELIELDDDECAIGFNNSFYFKGSIVAHSEECPVRDVSWYATVMYCNWLSEQEGLIPSYDLNTWECNFEANGYRLPTEAEWEYAARGGLSESDNYEYSGGNILDDVAWYCENAWDYPHEVGTKQPNQLGIYDMTGNVSEWCHDWFDDYNDNHQTNPTGPDEGVFRVLRSTSWRAEIEYCTVSNRNYNSPSECTSTAGFRIVRVYE